MNTTKLWQAREDPGMPKANAIVHTERIGWGWGMGAVGRGKGMAEGTGSPSSLWCTGKECRAPSDPVHGPGAAHIQQGSMEV